MAPSRYLGLSAASLQRAKTTYDPWRSAIETVRAPVLLLMSALHASSRSAPCNTSDSLLSVVCVTVSTVVRNGERISFFAKSMWKRAGLVGLRWFQHLAVVSARRAVVTAIGAA